MSSPGLSMSSRIDFQRGFYPWLLLMFSLFGLMACEPRDEPEHPDFSLTNWESGYDRILSFNAGSRFGNIELLTRTQPAILELSLNGNPVSFQSTVFDPALSMFRSSLNSSLVQHGSTLDYELVIDGKRTAANIRIPWTTDCVFPMFGEGAYYFEWTTDQAPMFYLVDFDWVLNSVPGRIKEQLDGNRLNHTIQTELWGGGVIYPNMLKLHAINLSRWDKALLVYSETVSTHRF